LKIERACCRTNFRKLINENLDNPRLAHWYVRLEWSFDSLRSGDEEENNANAIKKFKRSGQRGLGKGYFHVAEMYKEKENWKQTMWC
jgi:hypothetical protein